MWLIFIVELCSSLGVLEVLQRTWRSMPMQSKLHIELVSDYKSTLYRFNTTYRVVTILVKSYKVVWEILLIKKEILSEIIVSQGRYTLR